MALYRSLRGLNAIGRRQVNARSFLTSATAASFSIQPPYNHPLCFNPFLHPTSKWIAPFQGPLFLSPTPWKLSQSATPLYLRTGGVLKRVEALNLHLRLLRSRVRVRASAPAAVLAPGPPLRDWPEEKVSKESFVDSFVNAPNMISMGRLVSGPFLGWMIMNEWYSAALVVLAISGATDWLDGYVARKMNINSVVGSYMDPLADKVLIGCVALAMVHKDLLPTELVGIVVLRDVLLVGGAVYKRGSDLNWQWESWYDFFNLNGTNPEKVEPLFISKVNTVLQLVLVAAALLQPEFGTQETQAYITFLSWLVASTTVGSTAGYGAKYMIKKSLLKRR